MGIGRCTPRNTHQYEKREKKKRQMNKAPLAKAKRANKKAKPAKDRRTIRFGAIGRLWG
jgi:hypothetical protein